MGTINCKELVEGYKYKIHVEGNTKTATFYHIDQIPGTNKYNVYFKNPEYVDKNVDGEDKRYSMTQDEISRYNYNEKVKQEENAKKNVNKRPSPQLKGIIGNYYILKDLNNEKNNGLVKLINKKEPPIIYATDPMILYLEYKDNKRIIEIEDDASKYKLEPINLIKGEHYYGDNIMEGGKSKKSKTKKSKTKKSKTKKSKTKRQ
jgi:hypothetical protein